MHPTDVNALLILLNAVLAAAFIVARWRQQERVKERVVAAISVTLFWLLVVAGAFALATPWSPDGAIEVTAVCLLAVIVFARGNVFAGVAAGTHVLVGLAAIFHAQQLIDRPNCVAVYWDDRQVARLAMLVDDLHDVIRLERSKLPNIAHGAGWIEDVLPTTTVSREISGLVREKVGTDRWHTWLTRLREADPSLRYGVWIEAGSWTNMPAQLSIRTRPR